MSNQFSAEENKQRLAAKSKLAKVTTLIVIEDQFVRAYVKKIFVDMIGIESVVEFSHTDAAKNFLQTTQGKKTACIVCSVQFKDGSTGMDFIGYVRSKYRTVLAPFVLVGDDMQGKVEYVYLVKHFAGYIGPSFTPSKFIHMLLEVFSVRDRRRQTKESLAAAKENRPFNLLYEGRDDHKSI